MSRSVFVLGGGVGGGEGSEAGRLRGGRRGSPQRLLSGGGLVAGPACAVAAEHPIAG